MRAFTLFSLGAATFACLAVLGTSSTVAAQDRSPSTSSPSDVARPADTTPPANSAPSAQPSAPPPSGPLPPLPPGPPIPGGASAESTTAEAPPPPPPPPRDERPRRPWFGGLGYVAVGPYFGDLSGFEAPLRSSDVLGESYGFGSAALNLGGGGGAVLFGHLWLGGKGFGLFTGRFSNARGAAVLAGGGGGFELGYILPSHPRMLVIPFISVGGFSYALEVTNKTGSPMPVQSSYAIPAGDKRTFTAGFATAELGVRVHRLLSPRAGGFIGGFEIGLLRSLSAAPWKADNFEFTNQSGALLDGAYVRISFGGGGFFFR